MSHDFKLCVAGVNLIYVSYADNQHLASTDEQHALCRELQVRYDCHNRLVESLKELTSDKTKGEHDAAVKKARKVIAQHNKEQSQ